MATRTCTGGWVTLCQSGGGTGSPGGIGGTNPGGGGGDSGGGDGTSTQLETNYPDEIGISPNDGGKSDRKLEQLFNLLSQSLMDYINEPERNELKELIIQYVIDENFAPQAQVFALQAIKAKEESEDAEIDYENKSIYKANVPECLKEIINKLKPTEGFNVDFVGADSRLLQEMQLSNMILDLFNNDAGYSLEFKVQNLPLFNGRIVNAQTSPPITTLVNGVETMHIDISLDYTYLSNATDLAVARTMIHELIHAYFSYLQRSQPQGDIAQQLENLLNNATANSAEHTLMAANFVDSIANALGVWDNDNKMLQRNGLTFDYYSLLSWSGELMDTRFFSDKSPEFQYFSSLANKAEEGTVSILDAEMLPVLGQNNCN